MFLNILIFMCVIHLPFNVQNVLGLIYEAEKNLTKACDCYFIEAEILKKDPAKWEVVYEMSVKLNLHKRQIYCLSRIIHLEPSNPIYYEKRYQLYMEDNQQNRATSDLLSFCRLTHDLDHYISQLYTLCTANHRQPELLAFFEENYSAMIQELSPIFGIPHNEQKIDTNAILVWKRRTRTMQPLL